MDLDEMCKGKRSKGPWNELGKTLKAVLEISNRDVFKKLRVCKLGTWLGKIPEVFQKPEKN